MDKTIKITTPSGVNEFKLMTAFKKDDTSYVVVDSGKKDVNNGLTIVLVSELLDGKLVEFDDSKWSEKARPALISAVKGEGVEYIAVADEYEASENIGHPISLQDAHIAALTNGYVVEAAAQEAPVVENVEVQTVEETPVVEEAPTVEEPVADIPIETTEAPVVEEGNSLESSINNVDMTGPIDVAQIAAEANTVEPVVDIATPAVEEAPVMEQPEITEAPVIEEAPTIEEQPVMETPIVETNNETTISDDLNEIDEIKNNIIALCDRLKEKQQMIDAKLQVANKAYENAQNVMNNESNEEVISIQDYQPESNNEDIEIEQQPELQRTITAA